MKILEQWVKGMMKEFEELSEELVERSQNPNSISNMTKQSQTVKRISALAIMIMALGGKISDDE